MGSTTKPSSGASRHLLPEEKDTPAECPSPSGRGCREAAGEGYTKTLLPEREDKQGIACSDRDVLPAAQRIGHRAGNNAAADGELPQQLAVAGIQRIEVAF